MDPEPTPREDVIAELERIGGPVVLRIDALLSAEIGRWGDLDESIIQPLASLRKLVLAGGKRLRPAFCYWAFVGAGGDPDNVNVVSAGAALELLHSFALVHDDIMDDSMLRRGDDSVHVQFRKLHNSSSLRGEDRRFGEATAILVGDMAFVYADILMHGMSNDAIAVFNEMRVELNVGQYLDVWATAQSHATLPMAQRIAQFKSGKYTVERPMHLGAAIAGGPDELSFLISDYGMPVGEAFQMRDDILGAFEDSASTGKPLAGDLREGKPTALLAVARERATGKDLAFLDANYGRADISDDEVRELQRILIDTEALATVEHTVENLRNTGLKALETIPFTDEAKTHLFDLAHFVTGRAQ